jgi:multiple sugar transport system ATP-binding protein
MTRIRLENISKTFGKTTVVHDLDLSIEDGEFFTIVGPSGCGKTTVLNMIAGLETPTGGSILFDDKPVNELPPKERDVAMVFQSYALYPHMSVYENIAFPLKMKKAGKEIIDTEVRRVASLLDLDELLARKPKELSGGQRQRVALGRAMVRKPKVFLMDEPLSNLDVRLRTGMRAEIKLLHQKLGITTVYVTHDQAEAMGLSERIAVLHEGTIQQVGAPLEVYQKPINLFVAGFIGSPPMNMIRGRVRSRNPLEIDCNGTVIKPRTTVAQKTDSIVVGIRPEDVTVVAAGHGNGFPATVTLVEPIGSFTWVDAIWQGVSIKALSKSEQGIRPGSEVLLAFSNDAVRLFNEADGRAVDTPQRIRRRDDGVPKTASSP